MDLKQIFVASAMLTLTSISVATEVAEYVQFSSIVSTKSRAEVMAERDRESAAMPHDAHGYRYPIVESASTRTRAEVRDELMQHRAGHPVVNTDLSYPEVFLAQGQRDRFSDSQNVAQRQ